MEHAINVRTCVREEIGRSKIQDTNRRIIQINLNLLSQRVFRFLFIFIQTAVIL